MALATLLYDVIVIGAGPVGSYTAYSLATSGYHVAVFEAKEAIGSNVCCTGIISRECFDQFCPENTPIWRKASSANFFVSSGWYLKLEKDTVLAYVIDRGSLDRALAARAEEAGVDYFLQSKVMGIKVEGKGCEVETDCGGQRQKFQAKAIIVACGFSSTLPERLGMGKIRDLLFGTQAEVNTEVREVEVYFNQKLAPGGFAWLVPTFDGKGLAGVISRPRASSLLNSLLSKLIAEGKIKPQITHEFEIMQKAIPLGTLHRTYGDRILVVGEAAGQVKPTTGGGIYFGLLCAELAVSTLHEAFLADDLSSRQLSRYQKRWQAKIGSELRLGYWARKIYDKLSNKQIERIFDIVKSNRIHEQVLGKKDFSFDFHGKLILRTLGQPKLLPSFITPGWLLRIAGKKKDRFHLK